MKSFVRSKIIKNVTFLLTVIMVLMVANKAVFTHSHLLINGQVITHAHPYDKTNDSKPFKSHHHTQTELFFYENMKTLFPLVFLLLVLINLLKNKTLFIFPSTKIFTAYISLQKGRSPPVL